FAIDRGHRVDARGAAWNRLVDGLFSLAAAEKINRDEMETDLAAGVRDRPFVRFHLFHRAQKFLHQSCAGAPATVGLDQAGNDFDDQARARGQVYFAVAENQPNMASHLSAFLSRAEPRRGRTIAKISRYY